MTRILHLIPGLTGGGAERQVTLLAPAQAARGHSVHIGIVAGEVPSALIGVPNVEVHRLALRGNHDPLLLPRIYSLIRKVQADVVQTWLMMMDIMGASAAMFAGKPWILSERSQAGAYPTSLKNSARVRMGRRSSAIVANSSGGVDYWVNQGALPSKLSVIPNAVDAQSMLNATSLPLPPECAGRPLVLFVGRLSEEKRPFVLIDALSHALPATGAVALVCGTGPLSDAVRQDIHARKQEQNILMAGHRADVYGLLKQARVCVAISRFEGSPNVVLEAMTAGCPLVVSDIPAYRELLDSSCALFVPVDDATATAAAIVATLNDATAATARATRAQARTKSLTPMFIAESLDAVYDRLVGTSA